MWYIYAALESSHVTKDKRTAVFACFWMLPGLFGPLKSIEYFKIGIFGFKSSPRQFDKL